MTISWRISAMLNCNTGRRQNLQQDFNVDDQTWRTNKMLLVKRLNEQKCPEKLSWINRWVIRHSLIDQWGCWTVFGFFTHLKIYFILCINFILPSCVLCLIFLKFSLVIRTTQTIIYSIHTENIMDRTKALMRRPEQDPESALTVWCQRLNSVFTPFMNEMLCELLPEAEPGSPAQSSCSSHYAAAAAADKQQWSSSSELLRLASSGTAAAPCSRGNGVKGIQDGNGSHDAYVELQG